MSLASDNIPAVASNVYQRTGRLAVTEGGNTGTLVGGTYAVLPGTVAGSRLKGFTANTTLKTLTYIGAEKRNFRIAVDATLSHAHSSARTLTLGIEVNGAVAAIHEVALSVANGVTGRFQLEDLVELKRGDVVRVVVKQTNTEAITAAVGTRLTVIA